MASEIQHDLISLSEMNDYKVAEGYPDVRGWNVISQDGLKLGKVKELLVDRKALRVRYIDVQLNKDLFDRTVDRRILVPVGLAHLDQEDKRMRLERTSASDLLRLPPYSPGPITREFEVQMRNALTSSRGPSDAELRDREFYDHEHFNEDQFLQAPPRDREADEHARLRSS
jgi:hypothetical protein